MGHIWLIGMMGSGKTSVGQELANTLGLVFVDADDAVVASSGRSIENLFAEGEAAFRAVEHDVIIEIASIERCVVATGGGAVLDPANVAAMRASGTTVLLDANAQTLKVRLTGSTDRPLLTDGSDIDTVARERADVYRASADLTVETTNRTIDEVVEEVIRCVPM